ncbi:tRNA uridine-5-carboxymethylaminomethyl(34) synthesis GTPase MnmE [Pelagibaculum spongiae]|uniref:tRNA modification GTPase MnmE n=1 Tax=Pelagibaculum spongiae TaxID=2080658 RepID=A0A2V1GSG3_9GAMM|nr:tRNA uridine-5-carboxymethylaminomethyl(34) synthesis GTPase MnmE [Pelagibaculum spongiae]PVZ68232.1 tRNA uridine-5-carboxymethylaminomethyl(34) synthesis GTPase MnmE [Pelagibaculum spongiae]
MNNPVIDTIAAQATASGQGGVGIIRISGPRASPVAEKLLGFEPQVRYAHYAPFNDAQGEILDQGIALYFAAPNSFTGEDVVELQGHGGPVVMDMLLKQVLECGVRLARPGEFSERAFLNDKLDLAQAEAIADLISASSAQAVRGALRSLQGAMSDRIHNLVEKLTELRIYVEAAIDFPEEEIDFLGDGIVSGKLIHLAEMFNSIRKEAKQGSLLREGMTVVIAGRPNAGKSSLLNALAGREAAIVTDIAGTTRDVLREHIHIDGMPLHIIDTAGLRESDDKVEMIGVERAWGEIEKADKVLLVTDSREGTEINPHNLWPEFVDRLPEGVPLTVIRNKIDLLATEETSGLSIDNGQEVLRMSALSGDGIDELREHLKKVMGFEATNESGFLARRRHLDALERAEDHLKQGTMELEYSAAGELLAEELRQAQQVLGEITGEFSADDLLGKIFSSFCIGK